MTTLQIHHKAWLQLHPECTEKTLLSLIALGFDVYHVDGNADNDAAENLVLMTSSDYTRLHKRWGIYAAVLASSSHTSSFPTLGGTAYALRSSGKKWSEIGAQLGYDGDPTKQANAALNVARSYAHNKREEWPVTTKLDSGTGDLLANIINTMNGDNTDENT